jgi:dTDP-4-amino-4,6-dideoxygalactose transaminase
MAGIPFNKPFLTGREIHYISEASSRGQLAGDGYFTKKCNAWLEEKTGCYKALLTHSCTAALEMAAILADIRPGDEIIMPSYTFVSTANAFVIRGGVPVFIDIRQDTLNMNECLIEAAITPRTKAIVPVHYAGVGCEMNAIMSIARKYGLLVIEDAAQGVMASYEGRPLGSIGDLGCYSFHETKNISSGEGGALLINNPIFAERAEIIREKGTNRCQFFRGQVDKYSWVDIGSSYLPGELTAAFLWAQMECADFITKRRIEIWNFYDQLFHDLEHSLQRVRRPVIPEHCTHNAHMYYLILKDLRDRSQFISKASALGINCVFHYVPLHTSAVARENSRFRSLPITQDLSDRIVRMPLWIGVGEKMPYIANSLVGLLSPQSSLDSFSFNSSSS